MKKGLLTVLFVSFILINSCGIYRFSGASLHQDDKTVTVKFFPNRAAIVNPNLSTVFTEALKDQFISQTSLELVDFNGDLMFEGEITGYDTKPIAITQGEQQAYNRLTVTVRVKYTSINNEKYDFNTSFSRYSDYESSELLTDVEDGLIEVIVKELIDDIFNKSVVNW